MVEILENRESWEAYFHENFVAQLNKTGKTNFKLYSYVKNEEIPANAGIDVRQCRLMLISTAGGYIEGKQKPFDAADLIGDYTIRRLPLITPLEDLSFAHDHYDHKFVNIDRQSVLPLRHLEKLMNAGEIGDMAPDVISIMGYQPDAARVVDEIVPQIIEIANEHDIHGALLAPV